MTDTAIAPADPAAAPPADPAAPPADPAAAPPAGDPPVNMFAELGDNWRGDLLGVAGYEGDDLTSRQGQLERVVDLGTFTKNYFSAQDKIRNGEVSNGMPDNPTEQQVVDWRVANGVPETADSYELSLADGVVLGDNDKAILDPILAAGHELNLTNAQATAMTSKFLEGREAEMEVLERDDGIHKMQTAAQLKTAWGQDFETNVNLIKGFVAGLPDAVREGFESARMPDGRAMFNSPEVMVFFADKARQLNPSSTVVPNSNNPKGDIDTEIKELEGRMGEDAWHKDLEAQKRYQDLINAREAMKEQER